MSEPPSSRQSTWGSGVLQLGYPARWPSCKTKKAGLGAGLYFPHAPQHRVGREFRHWDSNPGRSGEGRVSQPARL